MGFFNIGRNFNKSPEELAKEIKEIKKKIKSYNDEISAAKAENKNRIDDIKEKIEKENDTFDKTIEKLDKEKATLLKKIKSFEKKRKTSFEKVANDRQKIQDDINNLKVQANSKKERKAKNKKNVLLDELHRKEEEYTESKTKLEYEHNHIINHYESLIKFEEDGLAELKENRARLIAEAETKIANLEKKKEKLSSSHLVKVTALDKEHTEVKEQINEKAALLVAKKQSDLKLLYDQLDEIVEKRDTLFDKFDKQEKEIEKEYLHLVAKHTGSKESAENYNKTLKIDLKKEQDKYDELIKKHNDEYDELKYFLDTLLAETSSDAKATAKDNKKEINEREKELQAKASKMKQSFDEDIKKKNVALDNEIADLELEIAKNTKVYDQKIKESENENESLKREYKMALDNATKEKNDLLDQLNALDTEYKNKIKEMNSKISSIKVQNDAHISDLERKMKDEIDTLTANYEDNKREKIAQINNEINDVKNAIRKSKEDHKQFVESFGSKTESYVAQNNKEMGLLANERDSLITSINILQEEANSKKEVFIKQIADINARINNAKEERNNKLDSLDFEHEQNLKSLQQKYDDKFIDLRKDHDNAIADIESKTDEKRKDFENRIAELENSTNNRITALEKEGMEIRDKYAAQINEVINQRNIINEQIQSIKENISHSAELFEQENELISQNLENNKKSMEVEHANKIKEIIRQYEEIPSQELEELKAKLEIEKENYSSLNSDLFNQKNQIEIEYEREKAELVSKKNELTSDIEKKTAIFNEFSAEKDSEYKFQLERVNSKKAELDELKTVINNEIQSINEKHNLELASLADDYNKKYNSVVNKYNQEELILKNRLDGELQYVSRDYERRKTDFESKLNEANIKKDKVESDLSSQYNIELEKSKSIENELKIIESDFKYKKADFDNRLDAKKKECDDSLNSLKQRCDDELEDMKKRYSDILSDLNEQKNQVNKEVELLITEYNNKNKAIDEIKQSKNKEISLLKIQITQLIEQFNKNDVFGEKQAKLELMHTKRMYDIKKDYADIIEEFEHLQSSRQGAGGLILSNEAELTKKAEDFKKILDSLETKHKQTMEELKNQYDISLKKISDEFKQYVDGNKEAISNCDNEIFNLQATYDNLIKAEEQKFTKLDSEVKLTKKQLEMIENQFVSRLKQIESGFENLNKEEKEKSDYILENERKKYEKQISDIKTEIDNLSEPRNSLNTKIRDLNKQQTDLEDEIFNQKQQLISLLDTAFNKLSDSYRDRVKDQKRKLKEFDIHKN